MRISHGRETRETPGDRDATKADCATKANAKVFSIIEKARRMQDADASNFFKPKEEALSFEPSRA